MTIPKRIPNHSILMISLMSHCAHLPTILGYSKTLTHSDAPFLRARTNRPLPHYKPSPPSSSNNHPPPSCWWHRPPIFPCSSRLSSRRWLVVVVVDGDFGAFFTNKILADFSRSHRFEKCVKLARPITSFICFNTEKIHGSISLKFLAILINFVKLYKKMTFTSKGRHTEMRTNGRSNR